jgi:hypothetical protein
MALMDKRHVDAEILRLFQWISPILLRESRIHNWRFPALLTS